MLIIMGFLLLFFLSEGHKMVFEMQNKIYPSVTYNGFHKNFFKKILNCY